MSHLQSFRVIRYRGLDGLDIPRVVPKVNLITGRNGAGKTSLLEAIWLFHGRFNPPLVWNRNIRRSPIVAIDPVVGLARERIELEGTEDNNPCSFRLEFVPSSSAAIRHGHAQQDRPYAGNGSESASIPVVVGGVTEGVSGAVQGQIHVWLDGEELDLRQGSGVHMTSKGPVLYPIAPEPVGRAAGIIEGGIQHPLALNTGLLDCYSDMVRSGRKPQLLDVLSVLDQGITDLEILTDKAGAHVWATTSDESSRPLYDLGGGMVRLFRVAVSLAGAHGGVLLVDEIENGLHHSVLGEFWERLNRMASAAGVQVFAATHSHECIDAAIAAFGEESEELAVHGLYRANGDGPREATFHSGATLAAARDLNFELR